MIDFVIGLQYSLIIIGQEIVTDFILVSVIGIIYVLLFFAL